MEGADRTDLLDALKASHDEPTAVERRLVERCVQIALGSLTGALKAMLEKATDDFFQLAQKSVERAMEQLHLEAMTLVRDRADEIECRFREHLHEGIQAALLPQRRPKRQPSLEDTGLDQFSLVDPDDLEESIATQEMASKMRGSATQELAALEKRMGQLLHDPEFQRVKNPFDPGVLAEAFMAACRDTEAPLKVRLLLVTMWDKHMQDAVASTYHEINQYLVEKGILPRIRHEIRRGASTTAEIAAIAAQAAVEAVQAAEADGDVFAAMQQWFQTAAQRGTLPGRMATLAAGMPAPGAAPGLVAGGGVAAGVMSPGQVAGPTGAPGLASAGAAVSAPAALAVGYNPVVLTQLTELQHGDATQPLTPLAQAAAGAPVAILRDIREGVLADKLSSAEAMTIELVAMVFDFIFDDKQVPDALKALIGRLQIPVLKAAMIDPAFFSKKTHPTRRLLNLLGEAATGWNGDLGHDDPLYRKVDVIVQHILDDFEDDLAIFEAAIEDFQAFLEEQERAADALVAAATPLIVEREKGELALEEAREAAEDAVRERASDSDVPEPVRALLCEAWTEVLAQAHLGGGTDGSPWKDAVDTMDDLLWSVRPKANREEREQLIKILPGLLRRLKSGMEAARIEVPVRERFMSQLVKCHAAAVSAGFAQEAPQAATPARESAVVLQFPRPQAASQPVKLEIITPAPVEGQLEVEEITISAVGWADDEEFAEEKAEDTPVREIDAETAREAVAALKPGMWVEFRHTGMEPLAAKLKWISPLKGAYLFCDRQGKRGATMPREKLEAAFRIGTARLLDEAPLLDRAVGNVIEALKQAAA